MDSGPTADDDESPMQMKSASNVITMTTFLFFFTNFVVVFDVLMFLDASITLTMLGSVPSVHGLTLYSVSIMEIFPVQLRVHCFMWLTMLVNCSYPILFHLSFHSAYRHTLNKIVIGSDDSPSLENTDNVVNELRMQRIISV